MVMLLPRMLPDEVQLSVKLAVLRHIYVCSDVNMSLSRSWWFIIVGYDGLEGYIRLMKSTLVYVVAMLRSRLRLDTIGTVEFNHGFPPFDLRLIFSFWRERGETT